MLLILWTLGKRSFSLSQTRAQHVQSCARANDYIQEISTAGEVVLDLVGEDLMSNPYTLNEERQFSIRSHSSSCLEVLPW